MEPVEIRAATPADDRAVLDLLGDSMGWMPDQLHQDFFAWKHRENAFGPSPGWVGLADGEIVAYRTFMRWEFWQQGRIARAVRAVDTATHPSQQGKGWFTRLTLHALEALAGEGVAFVFNTPNERSRPGYMKMGWQEVGRMPIAVRPTSLRAAPRIARARTAADKWSLETTAGEPAEAVLAEDGPLDALLASQPSDQRVRTNRTAAYLRWRYGFAPLSYRAVVAPGGVAAGLGLFRLRRRGGAIEAAVCEVLVPGGDRRPARSIFGQIAKDSGADYALWAGRDAMANGAIPVPRMGPVLVWRSTAEGTMPPAETWDLDLGDIELF